MNSLSSSFINLYMISVTIKYLISSNRCNNTTYDALFVTNITHSNNFPITWKSWFELKYWFKCFI